MKLSFVIPAYNEELRVGECLDAILKESHGKKYDIEIIVVNNASTDRTREVASERSGVKVVDEMRKGIVFARQAGYDVSSGELIANVDADTMITPGWIDTVFREFKKDDKLVTLSGPFIYYDLSKTSQSIVRFFYYITYLTYILNRFILRVGSVVQGGNFIVRRSALEKIGGFDTSIAFYGEDTDIARRMNKVGHVKFTFKLPMLSSGRRLAKEGVVTTGLRYSLNYLWMTFKGEPLTKKYSDLRPNENTPVLASSSGNRVREWLLGICVTLVTLAILVALIYGVYWLVINR